MAALAVLSRFITFRTLLPLTQANAYSTKKKGSKNQKKKHIKAQKPKSGEPFLHKTGIIYKFIRKNDDRLDKRMIRDNLEHQDLNQTVILKGKPLIDAALYSGFTPLRLFIVDGSALQGLKPYMLQNTEVFLISERQLALWTEVDKKCLVAGVFKKQILRKRPTIPVTLVCDQIEDGTCLGTLINTAAAVGCDKVIVMDGCVDIWDTKTFQAGDGCQLRIPVTSDVTWRLLPKLLPNASCTVYSVGPIAEKEIPASQNQDIVDTVDVHTMEQEELTRYLPILVMSFDSFDYSKDHSVVIVSGNPSGLSMPARKFMHDFFGRNIEVPKSADVPRVNISVQGSITLFHIAAQLRRFKE